MVCQKKTVKTTSGHITPVGGNIFADLGFAPEEAAALQAESKRIILEKRNALLKQQERPLEADDLQRIAALSRKLSANHLAENEAMDSAISDGLDQRDQSAPDRGNVHEK